MKRLSFKDCYNNNVCDLRVKEITNGKWLVSRTAYNKRITMETDKSWAIAIINDYKSSKLFPETKQEKDVYTRAYMHLCDAIRQDYKERLGL